MLKSQRPQRVRRLAVEGLERREMMATVSAAGGMLFITGNGTAENITVTQTTSGQIQVTGAGPTRAFPAVFGIHADLGGGNDTISLGTPDRPLPLLSSVVLRLGDGSDTANISVNIPGSVIVDGGMQSNGSVQNDAVNVDRSLIGSLFVNTYAGDDSLLVARSGVLSLFANLGVETVGVGQRDYDTAIFRASAVGIANISLGGSGVSTTLANALTVQSTLFGSLSVNGGSGIDVVTINSVGEGLGTWLPSHIVNTAETLEPLLRNLLARPQITSLLGNLDGLLDRLPSLPGLALPGGIEVDDLMTLLGSINANSFDLSNTLASLLQGIDLSFVGDTTLIGTANITTHSANDTVEINGSAFLVNATIQTGSGNDNVNLTGVNVVGNLMAILGDGADNLRLIEVAAAIAFLDGGSGVDGILNTGNTGLGRRSRTIINFEVPLIVTPTST